MPCSRSASRPSVSSDRSIGAPAALRLERVELVGAGSRGCRQQAADQRALAVVDVPAVRKRSARWSALRRAGRPRRGVGFEHGAHQKYPSFLRRSIEASEVRSSMRVAPRSLTVDGQRLGDDVGGVRGRRSRPGRCRSCRRRCESAPARVSTVSPASGGVTSVTGTSRPLRRITCAVVRVVQARAARCSRARCRARRRARSSC